MNDFFGLIECDIEVPKHLREKFSEMTPIFKNVKVSADDLMEPMKTFAIENGKLAQLQRMLIGSYFGKKILLMTPLAKWYLEHGLVITKVYKIVQYKPQACLKTFTNAVTNARREGDVDESKALLADISKLIGKSIILFIRSNILIHFNKFINTMFFISLREFSLWKDDHK